MALGKPAIATGYSGNLAFMDEESSYLVPYSLTTLERGRRPLSRRERSGPTRTSTRRRG